MKYGITMLSGKTFEFEAQTGDEAKRLAYRQVDKDNPGIQHSDPDRRVASVTPLKKKE